MFGGEGLGRWPIENWDRTNVRSNTTKVDSIFLRVVQNLRSCLAECGTLRQVRVVRFKPYLLKYPNEFLFRRKQIFTRDLRFFYIIVPLKMMLKNHSPRSVPRNFFTVMSSNSQVLFT